MCSQLHLNSPSPTRNTNFNYMARIHTCHVFVPPQEFFFRGGQNSEQSSTENFDRFLHNEGANDFTYVFLDILDQSFGHAMRR